MPERYVWRKGDGRDCLVDTQSDLILLRHEGGGRSHSVYWPTDVDLDEFAGYIDELHKRGLLNTIGQQAHIVSNDDSGNRREKAFPNVQEMLDYCLSDHNIEDSEVGDFLRIDTDSSYTWDNTPLTPFGQRIVGVTNVNGAAVENIIAMFQYTHACYLPGIEESDLRGALQSIVPSPASPESGK